MRSGPRWPARIDAQLVAQLLDQRGELHLEVCVQAGIAEKGTVDGVELGLIRALGRELAVCRDLGVGLDLESAGIGLPIFSSSTRAAP